MSTKHLMLGFSDNPTISIFRKWLMFVSFCISVSSLLLLVRDVLGHFNNSNKGFLGGGFLAALSDYHKQNTIRSAPYLPRRAWGPEGPGRAQERDRRAKKGKGGWERDQKAGAQKAQGEPERGPGKGTRGQ